MLRITEAEREGHETLKLEGRLAGSAVRELARVAERSLGRSPRLRLDLHAVGFVDAQGADLLRSLVRRGAQIQRSSSFVSVLLQGGYRWTHGTAG